MVTIARSSTCSLEKTHCPAAARHQELGTPRDRADMEVGTVVHHLVHAVASREDGELADDAIDRVAADLIASGRSFDGGPVEHLTMEHVDRARDFALEFLDRGVIPELSEVDWLESEVLVAVDRHFKRVDRDTCQCGHPDSQHRFGAGEDRECHAPGLRIDGVSVGCCHCLEFRPAAIWQQALDLVVRYQDEVDDEEVTVVETTDWKGGNCSKSWFTSLQGKGAAVTAVALFPDVDIVRRRVISYMPWGGRYEEDLDLRQQDDVDKLEDYRRAIEVAARGHAGRQGKTPDEMAQPGAGCSAGFGGCPWLMVCTPAGKQWAAVLSAWQHLNTIAPMTPRDVAAWASMLALAEAVKQEAAKRVRVALKSTDQVLTVDGGSVVGWKEFKGTKIAPNAAMLLAREWVEVMLKLEEGSPAAQLEQGRFEALLMNALPKKGGATLVKNLIKRLEDVIGYEAAAVLEVLCLKDDSGRQLKVWKKPAPPVDPMEKMKESIEAGPPPAPSGEAAAERKKAHDEKTGALLNSALKASIEEKSNGTS